MTTIPPVILPARSPASGGPLEGLWREKHPAFGGTKESPLKEILCRYSLLQNDSGNYQDPSAEGGLI